MSGPIDLAFGALFGGDFRIVRPLRSGGMGAVYLAEQVSTGAMRALKLMHPQLTQNPSLRKRFEQEARVGAKIKSDHVVTVISAGIDAQTQAPWLAMELLEGEDLGDRVAREGAIPSSEVLSIFGELCHALEAAHAVGVVHRDLKPENVFLARGRRAGDEFTVKVLDFGIAKILAEAGVSTGTSALGTPLWMAPEQASVGTSIVPATDVWALGLIAFYLLTGRYYWISANAADATLPALVREIAIDPIELASARAKRLGCELELPRGFDDWFARCTAREIEARFPEAGSAMVAMEAMLSSSGVIASPMRVPMKKMAETLAEPVVTPSQVERPRTTAGAVLSDASTASSTSKPSRRLGVAPIAVTVAAVVAAIAIYFVRHRGEQRALPPLAPATTAASLVDAPSASAPIDAAPKIPAPPSDAVLALEPMARVIGGSFVMGSNEGDADERPLHTRIVSTFYLDVTEVTAEMYRRCVDVGACTEPGALGTSCTGTNGARSKQPIDCVDAEQAARYCAWVGRRLPYEYEWEYAASGTEKRRFPWGADAPSDARVCFGRCSPQGEQGDLGPCDVGSHPLGDTPQKIADLAGNVWEWTSSSYCPYPQTECVSTDRVTRGGGWCSKSSVLVRTTVRDHRPPTERTPNIGFRCAKS